MISYNLDSLTAATNLQQICEKYKEEFDIDVILGRQIIDGCSLLGVASLIGHTVSIEVSDNTKEAYHMFKSEIEEVNKW